MAEYINERHPADRVIVHEYDRDSGTDSDRAKTNTGMVIGLIVLGVILLLLLFGRNLFGGAGNSPAGNQVRPTTPTTTTGE